MTQTTSHGVDRPRSVHFRIEQGGCARRASLTLQSLTLVSSRLLGLDPGGLRERLFDIQRQRALVPRPTATPTAAGISPTGGSDDYRAVLHH